LDGRLFRKSEALPLMCVVLGTLIGLGVWEMVTVVTAIIDNAFDLSVLYDDYLVFDFLYFQVVLPLWAHALLGAIEMGIPLAIAIMLAFKLKNGTFCEI
jgi:hypothetical protein